ncbi:hypothetical protein [Pedobacter zeae]|uniref:Uncharacterized protein n=1 Tax=Pedobacter zeae TaxID=1737356 RepID=A0A7W6P6Z5_9SPHI|nr:hypothetical protein [Pedobacter zeae]MBB4108471.1 hypothetical protein [Pedobacter zeae]
MTFQKIIQNYLGLFSALLILTCNLIYDWSASIDMNKVMDKSIDISSISFGFLLAVLAILVQANNEAIIRIRESGNYPTLISLNKKAVISCGLLIIAALIFIGFDLSSSKASLFNHSVRNIFDSICLSILVHQLIVVFMFLDIFYAIVKED